MEKIHIRPAVGSLTPSKTNLSPTPSSVTSSPGNDKKVSEARKATAHHEVDGLSAKQFKDRDEGVVSNTDAVRRANKANRKWRSVKKMVLSFVGKAENDSATK